MYDVFDALLAVAQARFTIPRQQLKRHSVRQNGSCRARPVFVL